MDKNDIFMYLLNGTNAYTLETIVFNMAMTLLLGLFMFVIYKVSFKGVIYSLSFNVSLIMVALVTAMVIMLIGSNLAISLGMVGALSIVRFRAAIKEPRDLAFLFWAVALGLASGTGAFLLAGICSLFIGALLLVFRKSSSSDNSYLLIVKGNWDETNMVENILKQYGIRHKLRLQNISRGFSEVTFEVYLKNQKGKTVVEHFKEIEGVEEVNLVSFNGEVTG